MYLNVVRCLKRLLAFVWGSRTDGCRVVKITAQVMGRSCDLWYSDYYKPNNHTACHSGSYSHAIVLFSTLSCDEKD